MRSVFLFLSLSFLASGLAAQSTSISGVINRYAAVLDIDTCYSALTLSDTSGFRPGGIAVLIQMQGANISTANDAAYGIIQNLGSAGFYERVNIDSLAGNAVFLQTQLLHPYQAAGKVQLVSMPQFSDATVTDTVFAQAWNGTTGGVLVLEVSGTLTLNAPLWADGAGFRGGAAFNALDNNCTWLVPESDYSYPYGSWRGSARGEGVAVANAGKEFGRGAQANGGGGGNDHNSGGGGGANIVGGGRGGDNDEPSAFGCDGYFPGVGGRGLGINAQGRLFLGGGGGAGHANNHLTAGGGAGGGIILVKAGSIEGTQPLISANGLSASQVFGDGAGGGGAGGTIRLEVGAIPASISVKADGGKGGNTRNNNQERCFGPGGGGSAGSIVSDLPLPGANGGAAGLVLFSASACNGTSDGAEPGSPYAVQPLAEMPEGLLPVFPTITVRPISDTVCSGTTALFTAAANAGNWNLQWQTLVDSVWQDIGPGTGYTGFQTDTLRLDTADYSQDGQQFRLIVRRPGCFEAVSTEAVLTVLPSPAAAFSWSLDSLTLSVVNQSADANTYVWDFGDGSVVEAFDPQHVFPEDGQYTVTLYAIGACDTAVMSQLIGVLNPPTADFSVPADSTACYSITLNPENLSSQNAQSFVWLFPGGNPGTSILENPSVTYTASGQYVLMLIVSNGSGSDTSVQIVMLTVLQSPGAGFTWSDLDGGTIQFNNLSQGALMYTWDFGDNSPQSQESDPLHTYATGGSYEVTLIATNACGASIFEDSISIVLVKTGEPNDAANWRIYPNPADDLVIVNLGVAIHEPTALRFYDATGRLCKEVPIGEPGRMEVPVGDLPAGAYWVQMILADGRRPGQLVWLYR